MSDSSSDESGDAARMVLEPDAVHEGNGEPSIDCPQCGATVTLTQVIEEGRCTGYLDADVAEVEAEEGEQLQEECNAALSLELVWEA